MNIMNFWTPYVRDGEQNTFIEIIPEIEVTHNVLFLYELALRCVTGHDASDKVYDASKSEEAA